MKLDVDGRWLCTLEGEGQGLFMPDGSLRITEAEGLGTYNDTGATRVAIDTEAVGIFDDTGAMRVSTTEGRGIYSPDGARYITLTNPPEEE